MLYVRYILYSKCECTLEPLSICLRLLCVEIHCLNGFNILTSRNRLKKRRQPSINSIGDMQYFCSTRLLVRLMIVIVLKEDRRLHSCRHHDRA